MTIVVLFFCYSYPQLLRERGFEGVEFPLIEHCEAEDTQNVPAALVEDNYWDWVVVTSPEAAKMLIKVREHHAYDYHHELVFPHSHYSKLPRMYMQAFTAANLNKPVTWRIASVGSGTSKVLQANPPTGFPVVSFEPSSAYGELLGEELPQLDNGTGRVLYPASAKAKTTLQDGLEARGFKVTRLNAYDTRPVSSVSTEALEQALEADCITVASPSALKAWLTIAGNHPSHMKVACIGQTSYNACKNLGMDMTLVFAPETNPGVESMVETVVMALGEGTRNAYGQGEILSDGTLLFRF